MSRERWSAVVLVAIALLCLLLYFPCLRPKIRITEARMYSANCAKQIAIALHNYHEEHGHLPQDITDKDGKPILSWRVALLPYIEEYPLHTQFRLDEPWDSPHNKQVSETTPRCYRPILGHSDDPGLTRYQALVGPGTAFERPGLTWDDFPDGRGSTLLVVEAGDPVPWSKPADLAYDPNGPLPRLGAGYTKPVHFLCREVRREPIFVAVFADGSVRFIRSSTDEGVLRAVITRNGGESVDVSGLE